MSYETFFLSRWVLKVVGFFLGRRRPEKAVKPVLYATADEKTAEMNGVFIG